MLFGNNTSKSQLLKSLRDTQIFKIEEIGKTIKLLL